MDNQEKDNNTEKTVSGQNGKSIFSYLKKIITWQSASFFAAIAVPFIIYYCQKTDVSPDKKSEIELLRDSIKQEISIIETTFKPENMVIDNRDERKDVMMDIKEYRLLSLQLATYWNIIEDSPPVNSFKDMEISVVNNILDSKANSYIYYFETLEDWMDLILSIDEYGQIVNDENYRMNMAMFGKFHLLYQDYLKKLMKYNERIAEFRKELAEFRKEPREIKDSTGNIPIVYETNKMFDEMCNSLEYYRLNHYLFKYIIAQNKKFESAYIAYKNDLDNGNIYYYEESDSLSSIEIQDSIENRIYERLRPDEME